jgi:hypothetical protein
VRSLPRRLPGSRLLTRHRAVPSLPPRRCRSSSVIDSVSSLVSGRKCRTPALAWWHVLRRRVRGRADGGRPDAAVAGVRSAGHGDAVAGRAAAGVRPDGGTTGSRPTPRLDLRDDPRRDPHRHRIQRRHPHQPATGPAAHRTTSPHPTTRTRTRPAPTTGIRPGRRPPTLLTRVAGSRALGRRRVPDGRRVTGRSRASRIWRPRGRGPGRPRPGRRPISGSRRGRCSVPVPVSAATRGHRPRLTGYPAPGRGISRSGSRGSSDGASPGARPARPAGPRATPR